MKKILFLLILCIIKLNAYEYLFYYNDKTSYNAQVKRAFFIDSNGKFVMRLYHNDSFDTINNINYVWLSCIKFNYSDAMGSYIKNVEFQNYFKNDLSFLNNLYTSNNTNRNAFLNYLYNENRFSNVNYINYENYELLFNSDGLVVQSIVNGKWAGLYDDSGQSGYLYNEKGDLLYVNGESASFFEKINNRILRKFKINLESIFIKNIFYPLLVLIFVCVIFRSVIRMAFKAFLIRFYDKKIGQLEKRRENIENA